MPIIDNANIKVHFSLGKICYILLRPFLTGNPGYSTLSIIDLDNDSIEPIYG